MMRNLFVLTLLSCAYLLAGCGGADTPANETTKPPTGSTPPSATELLKDNLAIPDNRNSLPLNVLFFGNSHSSPLLRQSLQTLLQTGRDNNANTAGGVGLAYLDERWADSSNLALLHSQRWTHLVLQAQKYSQSGQVDYSTVAAQLWVASAKRRAVTPVLYPEHPQRGNTLEGMFLYRLHQSIAKAQSACVAPIGPVWDAVLQQHPEISLHHDDGNHFNATGALLTAYVMYEVITGNPADALPDIASLDIANSTQQILRQAASAGLQQYPACAF